MIQTHVKSTVPSIPIPGRRFPNAHTDLLGPLSSASGYSYTLTIIDGTTGWQEATALTNISAEFCALAFSSTGIWLFGIPAQFTSSVWPVYLHPQSNGMIEHFHHSLKSSLPSSSSWAGLGSTPSFSSPGSSYYS